jgi:hypothetical protein
MNDLDWEAEHFRFMTVAYAGTVTSAKRAFSGWHSRKRDDAIQECLAKTWDQRSRLLLRGCDPEPMLNGLVNTVTAEDRVIGYDTAAGAAKFGATVLISTLGPGAVTNVARGFGGMRENPRQGKS